MPPLEARSKSQDYAHEFRWHMQRAKLGYLESQFTVGYLYLQGKGVDANRSEAEVWFNKAAKNGYHRALDALRENGFADPDLVVA